MNSFLKTIQEKGYISVFLDTNIIIYAFESVENVGWQIQMLFESAEKGDLKLIVSSLSYTECLVYPLRMKNEERIRAYKRFFIGSSQIQLIEITTNVLEKAAELRALNSSLKLADAIQVASAMISNADVFLTNDKRISIDSLPIITIS